jgi:tetratricopeptide (TPR) repeat protein
MSSSDGHGSKGVNIHGGIVNTGGGDIIGGNKFGLDAREVIALLEGKGHLAGLPLTIARKIVEAFGEQAGAFDAERIERLLNQKAEDYRALKERLDRLSDDDPVGQVLRREASRLIDSGDFAAADAHLADAEARDLTSAIEHEEIAKRKRLGAAASAGARGDAAMLHFAHREAANHYEKAADIATPLGDVDERCRWLTHRANALFVQGDDFGDNDALEEAIAGYRLCLGLRPRDRAPLDWAMAQNNLGNTLFRLGERERGTGRLEEAVAAYRAALEVWTRDRVPLGWATAQNNFGVALSRLGERESGTARLEEAVAAYRTALEEGTRERAPLDWANTQMNLGYTLRILGGRESGTARLQEAVAAFHAALEERTRDRVPLDWAMTQMNLGGALSDLGGRESGTARLEEAVAAYRAALEEQTRDRVPLDWAMSTGNQGVALARLAERLDDATQAHMAVQQIEVALATMQGSALTAAYYEPELQKARVLLDRLTSR